MKRIYIALFAMAATLLISSCSKDFITHNPSDSINADDALTDEASLSAALNGLYGALRPAGLFGRDIPVIGDLQADNSFVETSNSIRYINQYAYTMSSASGVASEIWSGAYNAILLANRIIDADVKGANIASIKATAYGLRALLYFKLVNIYARPYTADTSALGVPVVLHYNPYDLPRRSSVGTVYNQIISDFEASFAGSNEYTSSIYMNKYAAEALMAKAYLYMNKMQEAKAAAEDVINNSGISLLSYGNYTTFWNDPASHTDGVETLFEVDIDAYNNGGTDDLGDIYINTYADIYGTQSLYSLYGADDVRKSVMAEGVTKTNTPAIVVNKYPNAVVYDRDNIRVIRLSEVYLIAAEASARLSDEEAARSYLNTLMQQRDPSLVYFSSGSQLISDIVTERRKELAFEGDRFYDMNRLMLTIERGNNDGAIPTTATTVPYSDDRRIFPIPQDELQTNPNLANEQNPGY